MPRDVQDVVKELVLNAIKSSQDNSRNGKSSGGGPLSGMKGIAAGAGAAALAPLAIKGLGNAAKSLGVDQVSDVAKSPGKALKGVTSNLGDSVGSGIGDKVTDKVDEAGGPGGVLKDTVKGALPFGGGGGGGGSKGGVEGVGKGRRMPVQQSVDIGIPIESVYNQWTQFEDWPTFMHRVTRVTQEDDCTVSFAAKIWGKTKEFTAKIETQRPNERIKWKVSEGMTHTGVVTFHELGPNLTRVLVSLDVQPGSLIEKAARGMRHVKRAARGDLHRFKALIEIAEHETGAWRGVIEDGELVEEHDPSYDEDREFSDIEDFVQDSDEDEDEDSEEEGSEEEEDDSGEAEQNEGGGDDEEEAEEQPQARRPRRRQQSRNGGQEDDSSSQRRRPARSSRSRGSSNSGESSGGSRSSSSGSSRSRSSSGRGSSDSQSSGRRTRSRSSRAS